MSNKPTSSLLKTCSNCGEQKPLSAFLELTGPQGSSYSSVCFSCRKSFNEKTLIQKEPDEVTTSSTGLKIDAKVKVQGEIDKRALHKNIKEQDIKDREKKETLTQKQHDKMHSIWRNEKSHRKNYIEKQADQENAKKLEKQPPKPDEKPAVFGGEDHKLKAEKTDLKHSVDKDRYSGLLKSFSPVFLALKDSLPDSAPILTAVDRAMRRNKKPGDKTQPTEKLNEYVNKTFGPKGK